MAYNKMLQRIIANTDYTQKEIAEKCTELGTKISRSYVGKLEGNEGKIPSEDISRAIAKVCNADERLLVIEGYLDNAPKEIKDAFISLKYLTMLSGINILSNKLDKKDINLIKRKFEEEPLADFVIDLIEKGKVMINTKENGYEIQGQDDKIVFSLSKPIYLPIEDNSMSPLIIEGQKVGLEIKDKYKNGDIIAFTINNEKGILIRQLFHLGNQVVLTALNNEYKQITKNKEDITIIAKINSIITEI